MAFSLDQFYQLNRRALIWAALLGMLWLLRDFFGLVFLTFVIAFIASALVRWLTRQLGLNYHVALVCTYLVFLVLLGSFARFVTPQVLGEAGRLLGNLPAIEQRLVEVKEELVVQYPTLRRSAPGYLRSLLDADAQEAVARRLEFEAERLGLTAQDLAPYAEGGNGKPGLRERIEAYRRLEERALADAVLTRQLDTLREHFPQAVNLFYRMSLTLLLALLFSFLVLIDIKRLQAQVQSLGSSRLHDFYDEAAQPVVRFAYIVGRAIQAQAMIALINTALTGVGLLLLGIPSVSMLLLIVFVCSFVPVLGVFISTLPIVLVALNSGGPGLALAAIGFVVLIHVIEAYLLNPLIYGQHLKLNPVVVLIILFVGHHAFGVWGMLLGVPVAHYILHDVFGVPLWGQRRPPPADDAPA